MKRNDKIQALLQLLIPRIQASYKRRQMLVLVSENMTAPEEWLHHLHYDPGRLRMVGVPTWDVQCLHPHIQYYVYHVATGAVGHGKRFDSPFCGFLGHVLLRSKYTPNPTMVSSMACSFHSAQAPDLVWELLPILVAGTGENVLCLSSSCGRSILVGEVIRPAPYPRVSGKKRKAPVIIVSTAALVGTTMVTSWNCHVPHTMKPVIVDSYNYSMNGVDMAGQLGVHYAFQRKTLKWWRKVFWLLEVTVENSIILYKVAYPGLTFSTAVLLWRSMQHGAMMVLPLILVSAVPGRGATQTTLATPSGSTATFTSSTGSTSSVIVWCVQGRALEHA